MFAPKIRYFSHVDSELNGQTSASTTNAWKFNYWTQTDGHGRVKAIIRHCEMNIFFYYLFMRRCNLVLTAKCDNGKWFHFEINFCCCFSLLKLVAFIRIRSRGQVNSISWNEWKEFSHENGMSARIFPFRFWGRGKNTFKNSFYFFLFYFFSVYFVFLFSKTNSFSSFVYK